MSEFTYLFLKNFMGSLYLDSLGSSLPTISVMGGTGSVSVGSTSLSGSDNDPLYTLGTTMTSAGTAISVGGPNAYQKTMDQLQLTQAYVESLDEQQLNYLIDKIEAKDNELYFEEKKDNAVKKLTFTKNKN